MTKTKRWPVLGITRFVIFTDGGILKKKLFIFIACLWAFQASAQGTYKAASCSQAAVQAAITSEQAKAVDGDIISIPTGSCTWTSGINVTFANTVTIQGAGAISATTGGATTTGTDNTIIINHNGYNPVMNLTIASGKILRITGIAILEDSGSTSKYNGNLIIGGHGQIRLDHSHFYLNTNGTKGPWFGDGITGVMDHSYINGTQAVTNNIVVDNGQGWKGAPDPNGYGDASWNDGDHFGTNQFIYFEDSQMEYGYITDCSDGGRFVLRYSTFINTFGAEEHGTHSEYRGCREAEIYQSTFNLTYQPNSGGIVQNAGGPVLVWGNSLTGTASGNGYEDAIDVTTPRVDARYGASASPYPQAGFGLCGAIIAQSNGLKETSPWDGNHNTSTGYPCLDQPARGVGDLLSNVPFPNVCNLTLNPGCTSPGTNPYPRQALSPLYVWNNTVTTGTLPKGYVGNGEGVMADNTDYYQQYGTYGETGSNCTGSPCNIQTGINQTNRDPVNGADTCKGGTDPMTGGAAPGVGWWNTSKSKLWVCNPTNTWSVYYTPYTYPHPLTQSTSVTTVAPPTGLVANVQ